MKANQNGMPRTAINEGEIPLSKFVVGVNIEDVVRVVMIVS
jgi:hypothetical protein